MSKRFYRPELDAIRFTAFLAVFFHHGLPELNRPATDLIQSCLRFGLPLFFTLSAYLITLLLLKEKERTGGISLPSFYKRRILRIWPLYFAAIAASASISILHHSLAKVETWYIAAIFMVANFVIWQTPAIVTLWSISVEEQFYLFWPTLMSRFSPRALARIAVALLILSWSVVFLYGVQHGDLFKHIWRSSFTQLQYFATGILLALWHDRTPPRPYSWQLRTCAILAVPALWLFAASPIFQLENATHTAQNPLLLSIGYALVALSCALYIESLRGVTGWPKPVLYLGKISYGLYVFHAPILSAMDKLHVSALVRLPLALSLIIAAAAASYRWFESPFLRLKERFEIVPSRPVDGTPADQNNDTADAPHGQPGNVDTESAPA